MDNNAVNAAYNVPQTGTSVVPAQDAPQTLADVIGGSEQPVVQQNTQENTPSSSPSPAPIPEPGYLEGKRQKWKAQWDAEHQAEVRQLTEKTNSLMDRLIQREAQDLVSSGEFKSFDRAVEYLRLKEGMPSSQQDPPQSQTPPRDANGRFVSPSVQPNANEQRANELLAQAEFLHYSTGIDVMEIFNTNPEAKQMILSGGNFGDVLKHFGPGAQAQRPQAPAVNRSPNGIGIGSMSISGMTDDQFNKLNDMLAKGHKIDMTR